MDKQKLSVTELVNLLLTDTSRETRRDVEFLRNQIEVRQRIGSDPNWDANCGIAAPSIVAAFSRALQRAQAL